MSDGTIQSIGIMIIITIWLICETIIKVFASKKVSMKTIDIVYKVLGDAIAHLSKNQFTSAELLELKDDLQKARKEVEKVR